ncbi:hypothetical protein [Algibacter sp. L3A6]|uniref:hypothetical protein n=1 Tax=Algibacter sp. L3A6 TaxID=2686366 RepID=UPI00131E89F8|nr:hypothetical protein [Algibacter sp. L3A6]
MKKLRNIISICSMLFWVTANAQSDPVAVSVSTSNPQHVISPTSIGVSYEIELLQLEKDEIPYFRPDNKPLISMFKTLGIKNLRLGGNTLDYTKKAVPGEEQIASCFEFARAAGAEIIYSVRLKDTNQKGEPEVENFNKDNAAKAAKFIHSKYSDVLNSFSIGNEPYYYKEWDVYKVKWKGIHDVIIAEYPEAVFSGPDHNPNAELDNNMVREFSDIEGPMVKIARHFYPFGSSYENPRRPKGVALIPKNEVESRDKMLSPSIHKKYGNVYKRITQAQALSDAEVGYRLTESNSFSMSGLKDVSDSYASALWGLDYLHWWTSHKAEGIDFHTGDKTSGVGLCKYAVFVTSKKGYKARPLAYGMKLFDLGGHGKMLPIENPSTNIAVYATLDDNIAAVTIINKEHGDEAKEQVVQIKLDAKVNASKSKIIFLRGRNNDISGGEDDVTIGGEKINEDGSWDGKWTPLRKIGVVKDNVIEVKIPPASAAVVRVVIL